MLRNSKALILENESEGSILITQFSHLKVSFVLSRYE